MNRQQLQPIFHPYNLETKSAMEENYIFRETEMLFVGATNSLMHFSPRKPHFGSGIGGPLPTQLIRLNR